MSNAAALEALSRSELIERARELGVERPERMTRAELRDEILRLSAPRGQDDEARGLFGVARSMLANVVEAGLHMPDAAAVIRGESSFDVRVKTQPPVATVTLAEIYAAQGHRRRAVRMLDDVLAAEPDHEHARELRQRLVDELAGRSAEAEPAQATELVETTGEEIRTGKPPEVAPVTAAPAGPIVPGSAPKLEPEPESAPAPELASAVPSREALESAPPGSFEAPAPSEDIPSVFAFDHAAPESAAAADQAASDYAVASEHDAATEVVASSAEPAVESAAPSEVAPPAPPTSFPFEVPHEDALFIEVDERGVAVYWELCPATLDRVRRRMPEGETVLRVVALRPSWEGAERFERTVVVHEETGVLRLSEIRPSETQGPSVVRAAIGWQSPEGFTPLALGSDLAGDYRPPVLPTDFQSAQSRARARLEGI
jgi:hypothetical protein